MNNLLKLIALLFLLFTQQSFAKEIAVLLPVTGAASPFEQAELTQEAVEGLSAKFDLKHGEEVDQFVKQVFHDESKKKDCDEENCYRRIAARYQADKIVAFRMLERAQGNYLVTSHSYDVPTGTMTLSEQKFCVQCTTQKLKALFKELATGLARAN
jgi:hypothetical protein